MLLCLLKSSCGHDGNTLLRTYPMLSSASHSNQASECSFARHQLPLSGKQYQFSLPPMQALVALVGHNPEVHPVVRRVACLHGPQDITGAVVTNVPGPLVTTVLAGPIVYSTQTENIDK